MKNIYKRIVATLFLTSLWIILLSIFLTKDKEYSENENRYLTTKPDISIEDIKSKKFMDTFETYLNDQFPLRDKWTAFKTDIQRCLGKTDINGVYLGSDGYLFEKWTQQDFNQKNLQQNIESIKNFIQTNNDKKGSILIVPTSSLLLQEKLPKNAPMFNQNIAFDMIQSSLGNDNQQINGIPSNTNCQLIDIRSTLNSHQQEYIYYKTDHHWTTFGAYLAYAEWKRQNESNTNNTDSSNMNLSNTDFLHSDLSDYNITLAADDFKGSLYSKVLNRDAAFDEIYIYDKIQKPTYNVTYNLGKTQTDSVYESKRLQEKDKYQVFLNGNHPELTISTNLNNGKHLLIFKDSFANAFIPFLISDYETIHVLDLRYFKGDLNDYISQNNITEYLFLYNIKNLCEDTSLPMIH